jgi:hypothetical protein
MEASVKARKDGSVDLHLDGEAARAMLASVLFASRFHDGIAPLARLAEAAIGSDQRLEVGGGPLCQ